MNAMYRQTLYYLLSILVMLSVGLVGCQPTGETGEESSTFIGMTNRSTSGSASRSTAIPRSSPTPTPTPPPTATPTPLPPFSLQETDNILLLGTDRRPNTSNWRTDSIMIVGLDRQYNRAALLSIPRDLYVNIPRYGQARINQADYLGERVLSVEGGGPALLSQVISETLGIETNHWVRLEMTGFQPLVDALGGVTVELDCPFYELIYDLDIQDWTYFTLPAGPNLLTGQQAYFFVTLRLVESDIGRSQRQRQFLWALRNQALDMGLITRLPELWSAFNQTFSTDLSLLEMISLARFGLNLSPENVRSSAITNQELDRFITSAGADVLVMNDPAKVQAVIDNIWSGSSLAETGRHDPTACPAPPRGVPNYVRTMLTPTVTPEAPQGTPVPGEEEEVEQAEEQEITSNE
jgi:LCP family protein required for cell wall assembly